MSKNRVTAILALLLAALLLCGCGPVEQAVPAMATARPESAAAPTAGPTSAPTAESAAASVHAQVDHADMRWYEYDMDEFDDRVAALARRPAAELTAEYDWLYAQVAELYTLDELAWIQYYADPDSDYWYDACADTDEKLTEAADALKSAVAAALVSSAGATLAEHIGPDAAEALGDYSGMSEQESDLLEEETELQLQYEQLMGRDDLDEQQLNDRAGDLLLRMVTLRNQLAALNGYDSYPAYAYAEVYDRDYSPADAAALWAAVKPMAAQYMDECYYSDVFFQDLGSAEQFTAQELLDLLEEYAAPLSPDMEEALSYMRRHGLYLLGTEDEISDLGFTTTLASYNAPFLYNCLYGTVSDVGDMLHEFGHYCDAYVNPQPNILVDGGCYDVFEIHSTGLETLGYGWYDQIFGGAADVARAYCLDGLFYNVLSGCLFDEFQQYIYSHAGLTVRDLNQTFSRLSAEYGLELEGEDSYYWMYVDHNFTSPMYYISYAVSSLASLQLWSLASHDRAGAEDVYRQLLSLGAYELSYTALMEQLGMTPFTQEPLAGVEDAYARLLQLCGHDEGRDKYMKAA